MTWKTILKWVRYIADLLTDADEKYDKHFGTQSTPVTQKTPEDEKSEY